MRILHISDLHYGFHHWLETPAVDGAAHVRTLVRALSNCLERQDRIDAVVVSGDVTQRGAETEFRIAATELRQLANSLGLREKDIVVTPGNHDIDWNISKSDPKKRFDPWRAFLNDLYTPDLAARLYPPNSPGFATVHSFAEQEVAIATLSSCLFENHQDHYGYVGRAQLDRLASLLVDAPRWRIVATHHHLLPTPAEAVPADPASGAATVIDVSVIRDGGVILQELGSLGVRAVLHGHKHDPVQRYHAFMRTPGAGVLLLGAGSAGVKHEELPPGRSHHAQIITVDHRGVPFVQELTEKNYQWSLGQQELLYECYDELADLRSELSARKMGKGGKGRTLLDLVHAAAGALKGNLDNVSARDLMESIERNASKSQVESAYWWLIVLGILRFKDVEYWWDEEDWEGSVDRTSIARRGQMLLHQLARR